MKILTLDLIPLGSLCIDDSVGWLGDVKSIALDRDYRPVYTLESVDVGSWVAKDNRRLRMLVDASKTSDERETERKESQARREMDEHDSGLDPSSHYARSGE